MSRPVPATHKQVDSPQEVATPWAIFQKWSSFWDFGIDLAASAENTKCAVYIDKDQNSLTRDWSKLTSKELPGWLNHEYKDNRIWVPKCYQEALRGATVVNLMPCALHRTFAKKYMRNGPCAVLPFGPPIKFEGYPTASSILHMFVVWNAGLRGEIYWIDLNEEEHLHEVFEEIRSKLV